jgi:hypothetical protein
LSQEFMIATFNPNQAMQRTTRRDDHSPAN